MLGSSRRQQAKEEAERLYADAVKWADEARSLKVEAEKVKRRNQRTRYPDPEAVRAIVRDLDANRRICEANAKDLRRTADYFAREAKRWL